MIRFRSVSMDDLALLKSWDEQPHVLAALGGDSDWEWEDDLAVDPDWREFLIAEADGRPVGFVQIIDPQREETHYWGDCGPGLRAIDIWIGPPDALGKGYGTEIMRRALARCFGSPGVEAVVIDPLASNAAARRFYERCGFAFMEERVFENEVCAVHRLERGAWERRAFTDEDPQDLFCRLYVNCDLDPEALLATVQAALGAYRRASSSWLNTEHMWLGYTDERSLPELTREENRRVLFERSERDFVLFVDQFEVNAVNPDITDAQAYKAELGRLVAVLRKQGFDCVPACSFEDELPPRPSA
jgi:aminoglycoside 6'-N-acetyltransferase